ncbi:bath-42 [Symbiodinium microadriaticum]|nr:bath-42 [Symbiodinium microadriaticum]
MRRLTLCVWLGELPALRSDAVAVMCGGMSTDARTRTKPHSTLRYLCVGLALPGEGGVVGEKGLVFLLNSPLGKVAEDGGLFWSALNLRIFAAFWRQVISDGHYLLYNWIVKADPDTVFFVDRLRNVLELHEEGSQDLASTGVYLNNCKFGLHGPLEVFSQSAVRALTTSFPGCFKYFQKLCSGDCQWGEDMWVDQCLQRFVHSHRASIPRPP